MGGLFILFGNYNVDDIIKLWNSNHSKVFAAVGAVLDGEQLICLPSLFVILFYTHLDTSFLVDVVFQGRKVGPRACVDGLGGLVACQVHAAASFTSSPHDLVHPEASFTTPINGFLLPELEFFLFFLELN